MAEFVLGPEMPEMKLECFNPPMDVPLYRVPNTRGKAGTYNVQFNVNIPAVPGTLFVDTHNDAICNIKTTRNVTGGRGTIIRPDSTVPDVVVVEFQHIEKDAPRFIVKLVAPTNSSQGVANLRFEVDYD